MKFSNFRIKSCQLTESTKAIIFASQSDLVLKWYVEIFSVLWWKKMTETITEDYLAQQRLLHENPNYGVASLSFAPLVADLIRQIGAKSVSDYGAGKNDSLMDYVMLELS